MKLYVAVAVLAGTLLTAGGALAYHPTGPSPSYEEIERNEFQHTLQGQRTGHVGRGRVGDARVVAPSHPTGTEPGRSRGSSGHGGY